MNCNDFEKNIDTFLSGSLEEDQLKAMEEHRCSCASCARLAHLYSLIVASLDNTETVRAPEGLSEKILASVESEVPVNIEKFAPAETILSSYGNAASLDCGIFEKNVEAYVEDFLSGELLAAMEEHRTSCSSCERMVNIYETVLYSLNNAEPVKAPEGLADRILAAVEVESAETEKAFGMIKSYSRYWKLATGLAAAGSLMAAFIILAGDIIKDFSGIGNWSIDFESLFYNIAVLPLVLKAWIAGIIPAEQWVQINLLLEPIQLPYLSLSIPPYYFVVCIVFTTTALAFLKKFDLLQYSL